MLFITRDYQKLMSETSNGELKETGEPINDGDFVARAIFFKSSFEGDRLGVNKLLAFQGNRNPDGSFHESLFLKRLTTDVELNEANCGVAVEKNDRVSKKRLANGLPPSPVSGEDKVYYCGFTEALAGSLRITGEKYRVDLKHERDDDDELPCHLHIYLRPTSEAKLKPNDKTEAGILLARQFANPTPHVCPVDQNDPEHPVTKYGAACLLC